MTRHWEWIPKIAAVAFIAAVLFGCANHGVENYTHALEVLL
jgi:hypothetical protein